MASGAKTGLGSIEEGSRQGQLGAAVGQDHRMSKRQAGHAQHRSQSSRTSDRPPATYEKRSQTASRKQSDDQSSQHAVQLLAGLVHQTGLHVEGYIEERKGLSAISKKRPLAFFRPTHCDDRLDASGIDELTCFVEKPLAKRLSRIGRAGDRQD